MKEEATEMVVKTPYPNKCYDGPIERVVVDQEFISRNKLCLSRTADDVKEKIDSEKNDLFGFSRDVYFDLLSKESCLPYLSKEGREKLGSGEYQHRQLTDVQEVAQDMVDYLVFGLGKALDQRGLSASRTVEKLAAWAWALDREDLADILKDDDNYNPYGMPALIKVCEALGIDPSDECRKFAEVKCYD